MENGVNKSPPKGKTNRNPPKRGQIKAKIMEGIVKSVVAVIFAKEDGEGGGGHGDGGGGSSAASSP
ncbi:hypothetical protein BVC80_1835g615 [Macleaya cordata]|uniref:Uncharacterized protein n=1 Tax=Macleaya cordata TaxID=56857 RepID=A0A200R682_MACCD|nr:hypothetical protein BVC80_1835g615 [Macleaya cordata]